MRNDLDSLRSEIEQALTEGRFVVFHGTPRLSEPGKTVHWDQEKYSDPHLFLKIAKDLDAKLVVFHHRSFSGDMVKRVEQILESLELPRDEYRDFERRLKKLSGYEGFICSLEISFDYQGNTYLYDVSTPWYRDFIQIMDEIEEMEEMGPFDDDSEPMGGYFSNN
ncbi:MAG: hypothetical protein FJW20_23325 [Acidimicrobiia bacterium]|nr:hypothetical protein [Acidimicrobiia bacterium]